MFTARSILATGSDTLGPDATTDVALQATTRTLLHGGITLENVGPHLPRMRAHGDWIAVNGNRPAFSGFQMGFTGFTLTGLNRSRGRGTTQASRHRLDPGQVGRAGDGLGRTGNTDRVRRSTCPDEYCLQYPFTTRSHPVHGHISLRTMPVVRVLGS